MILLLGDTHCKYDLIDQQVMHAEETEKQRVGAVIQLGDFGIYRKTLKRYFVFPEERFFQRPVFFIDGNHEEFFFLNTLTRQYADRFTHLKRGTVHNVFGFRILSLGGSSYMDPVNTPPGAVIQPREIDRALGYRPEDVDIVISHDCPAGIGVPGTPGFEYCGNPGFDRSPEIARRFKPRLWFFAHHHQWFSYFDGTTGYFGLDTAEKGYALLRGGYEIRVVRNQIDSRFIPSRTGPESLKPPLTKALIQRYRGKKTARFAKKKKHGGERQ